LLEGRKFFSIFILRSILSIISIILFFNLSITESASFSDNFIIYEDPFNGIKISYPSSWDKIENGNNVTFETNNSVNVTLNVLNYTTGLIHDFVYEKIRTLNYSLIDFKILDLNATDSNNYKTAFNINYIFRSGHQYFKVLENLIFSDDKVYTIRYSAERELYSLYLPIIQKMIETFQIIEFVHYDNPIFGVRMDHPSNWKLTEQSSEYYDSIYIAPSKAGIFFTLSISQAIETSLDESLNYLINYYYIIYPNFIPFDSNITNMLAGNKAKIVKFTFTDRLTGYEKIGITYITIKNDKKYSLSYIANKELFYTYMPTVQKIIDTFEILEMVSYENPTIGIRIQYPSSWKNTETQGGVKFTSPSEGFDDFKDYFRISFIDSNRRPLDKIPTGDESFSNFEIVDSNITLLDGNKAKMILYKFTTILSLEDRKEREQEITVLKIITINNNKEYYISYSAESKSFEKYISTIKYMIENFKFLNYISYENPNIGIIIDVPSHWKKNYYTNSTQFMSPLKDKYDRFKENIMIYTNDSKKTLYEIEQQQIKLIQDFDFFQKYENILLNTTDPNNKINASILEYQYREQNRTQHVMHLIATDEDRGKVYNLKYIGEIPDYENMLPTISKIIDSLIIIKLTQDDKLKFIPYKNYNYGIQLSYPSNTNITEFNNGFSIPLTSNTYIDFFIESKNLPFYEVIAGGINYYRQLYSDFYLIESNNTISNNTMFSNTSAYKIVYSYTDPYGEIKKEMKLFIEKEDKFYYITYIANYHEYYIHLKTVEKIINTFTIDKDLIYNDNRDISKIKFTDTVDSLRPELSGINVHGNPFAVAFNSNTRLLYATLISSDKVLVIEDTDYRLLAEIKVGRYPTSIGIDHYTNTIYVTNRDSDTVSIIDGNTNNLIDNLKVGSKPMDIAVNSYNGMIYVANDGTDTVSIIDSSTNSITSNITLTKDILENPYSGIGIAVNPYTNTIYVADHGSNKTYIIDGKHNRIIDTVYTPQGYSVGVNVNTNNIFVASEKNLYIISGDTNSIIENFSFDEGSPNTLNVNQVTGNAYVTVSNLNLVYVIKDSNRDEEFETVPIEVGNYPIGITSDGNTNTIYVVNSDSKTISMINGDTNKVMVGVTFNIDPPNAGILICNDKEISEREYIKYDINTSISCEAKAKSYFPPGTYSSMSIIPPTIFGSWFNNLASNTNNLSKISFTIGQFGNVTAKFDEYIPSSYISQIFEPSNIITILTVVIPAILTVIYATRKKRYKKLILKSIDNAYNRSKTNKEKLNQLSGLRTKIDILLDEGKTNENDYEKLEQKISQYEENINGKA
jgi:YVTN family beta-propeller protein